jgi:adenosylmethionine-8-amino-7-oxononanoate aminotransferase
VIPPHKSFAPMVRDICTRNGILLITDEVITAYGRTGAWSGARLWGIQPDMMCTAKAITNGFFPFGAVMMGDRMVEAFEDNPEAKIAHGYTYSGHPVGAAAALACLAETKRLNVIENAAACGDQIYNGCKALMDKHDIIGDVRGGHGLMTAIELVSDRATKKPIDGASTNRLHEATYRAGAMIRISGPNIILSPSLVLSEQDADVILSALDAGLAAV